MNTLITFGKYNGQTYDYIIKNNIKYCNYIISQNGKSKSFINFQQFLKENTEIFKNKYDIKHLKNICKINCSDLPEYMIYDKNVTELIDNYKIIINKIDNIHNIEDFNLPSNYFGIFIDYLIRYEICKRKMIIFNDDRANSRLYSTIYIDDERFMLSEEELKLNEYIKKSYDNMKENKASIKDIFNVSICHSLCFCDRNILDYINYENIITDNLYNNIIKYIDMKIFNKDIVLPNPSLGNNNLRICADADLIIDNELIDIKTSRYNQIGNNNNDFIQLFIYASLYYKLTNKYINKLTIFNPLYLTEYSINIDNEMIHKFLDILTNYNIGKNYNKNIHPIDKLKTLDFNIDKLIYDFNKNLSNHYKFLNKIKIKLDIQI